jgi:4-hydroxy-3-polyprenylbenzoate decarboxylase
VPDVVEGRHLSRTGRVTRNEPLRAARGADSFFCHLRGVRAAAARSAYGFARDRRFRRARQDFLSRYHDENVDGNPTPLPLILGVSGASGARLAFRALALFAGSDDVSELHVVVSPHALRVAADEEATRARDGRAYVDAAGLDEAARARVVVHDEAAIDAPISSGSFVTRGMAVLPCSGGTLASIAHGISRGLLQRAADVCLKERRRLVLGLRETPLSLVHADNIVAATRAGAVVAPPVPAFYAGRTADELLDAYLLRVADLLGIRVDTRDFRWKGRTT